MKVLHITNWYPNQFNEKEATWIKNHIKALSTSCDNDVIHFQISSNEKFKIFRHYENRFRQILIKLPLEKWFFFEIIHFVFLFDLVIKGTFKKYDIINFHIAYPMLTYWHWIKKWVKKPIVITEHWSAYHFNFGAKKQLPRIQKIFRQNIPVITVSEALAKDIQQFAKRKYPCYIVPNVVDEKVFFHINNQERNPFFFMVSQWKKPKTPLLVMQAFLESKYSDNFTLKIGGYGSLWDDMQNFVKEKNAEGKIELLGLLESRQIADSMQKCTAFLHPSDYETFSVVCAEAVASGAYVIAPKLGGIPEVVGRNGYLIKENELNQWKEAFHQIPNDFKSDYNGRFNSEQIGKKYLEVLQEVKENLEIKG